MKLNNVEHSPASEAAPAGIAPDYTYVNTVGRIAVYDDLRSAPRIMEVPPADTASYIDSLSMTIYQQAQAIGGTIPHMVIREVSENFIHAQFQEVLVSILDRGNTIRFADHGPGITSKDKVQQLGFSSASEPMRSYIRGVGSGFPIVREYLEVSGGTITIEDNVGTGTVVTVSLVRPEDDPMEDWEEQPGPAAYPAAPAAQAMAPAAPQNYGQMAGYQQTVAPTPAYAPYPPAPAGYPAYQPYPQAPAPNPYGYAAPVAAPMMPAAVPAPVLNQRQRDILRYLAAEGMLSNKDLIARTGVPDATMSVDIKKLCEFGLVQTTGRGVRSLTPYGQQVAQTL